jgi:hypothetical protein
VEEIGPRQDAMILCRSTLWRSTLWRSAHSWYMATPIRIENVLSDGRKDEQRDLSGPAQPPTGPTGLF